MKRSAHSREVMATVWTASIASGALVAQHVAGKAIRDTLFLSHFGLGLLPAAMIGAALVSSIAVIGISRALGKYGPARIVPFMFGSAAALFLGEWWLSLYSARAAAIAVYLHTAVFGSAAVSAFWSLVNERFDPHTAKKVVGRIASGGTVGGVLGGLVVWRASAHLSVPMMLALLAAMNAIGVWAALRLVAGVERSSTPLPHGPEPLAGDGWKIVRETPYLRDLALLVLAGAVVQALLDWLLSAHASAVYGKGPRLLGFFALFNMVVGVLSFVAQTGLSRRLLEWRGLAGTVKSQPITIALGAALALVSPQLWTVVLLRGGEAISRNSLYRSAYELFYTPLPTAKKRSTKTIIDVGVDRVGTTIGSVALLAIVHFGTEVATRAVLIASMALAALAWLAATRLHDGYVSALASSLESGAVALGEDDAEDLTTKRTLAETTALLDREKLLQRIEQFQRTEASEVGPAAGVEIASRPPLAGVSLDVGSIPAPELAADPVVARAAALRGGDVARIRAALAAPLDPSLAAFAVPLLANDAVVRDAVRSLRKVAPKATGQLLDALLNPEVDPRVRRRIPRVLRVCRTQRAASGLLLALSDPLFEVRVQVALALAHMQDEVRAPFARDDVFDLAVHEVTVGRSGWGETTPAEGDAARPTPMPPPAIRPGEDDPHLSADVVNDGGSHRQRASSPSDELHRGLLHVFGVLGLVLDREPLSIAYRAIRSENPVLRGTAREYLEVVLPVRVRDVLLPLLGEAGRASEVKRAEGAELLAAELLRSSASLARPAR